MENHSLRILEIIHKNPRTSPKLIHSQMKDILNRPYIQNILRSLRETGQVECPTRGMYLITAKGVETLRTSEKTADKVEQ